MDWLFVRVNLNKKKAILFNFFFSVVKSLSRSGRVEPWFCGEALPAGSCGHEWDCFLVVVFFCPF